jgi:diguanylate cyclase
MTESGIQISLLMLLLVSTVQLVVGVACGWLFRGNRNGAGNAAAENNSQQTRKLNEMLSRMHELTGSIGQDVGAHADRVQAIGAKLAQAQSAGGDNLEAALLSAMAQVAEANDQLRGRLNNAEKKLEEQAGQIEHQMAEARTDALTGLANRRAFDDELNRRLAEYLRLKTPVSLMMLDVDFFKKFNDTHGHLAGDEVLRRVARVLFGTMREMDLVARYGGEEFAVIFPATCAQDARRGVDRARAAIADSAFEFEGTTLSVTASCGLAEAIVGDDASSIIKRADEALYSSKKAGRNCGHLHNGATCELITLRTEPAAATPAKPAKTEEKPAPKAKAPAQAEPVEAFLETNNEERPIQLKPSQPRTDLLTGLPNYVAFCEDLRRRIAQRRRSEMELSLLLVDIDDLAAINTKHGEEMGNLVLRAVSQFLTAALRGMDLVARFDGDRFGLLLPVTNLANAILVAERVRKAIGLCNLKVGSSEVHFTVSIGVAEASANDDMESLMKHSELALHESQGSGGNCSHFFNGTTCEACQSMCETA